MNEDRIKKTGMLLIIGGVFVALITLGGFYLSQNPQIISKWKYERDSARQDELREVLLVAPEACISVSSSLFETACAKIEIHNFEEDFDWTTGFSQQALTCMRDSFRTTTAFKLKYDGDPASNLKNLEGNGGVVLHACGVSEDLKFYRPDLERGGAKQVFDAWYQWKHSEGNFFN